MPFGLLRGIMERLESRYGYDFHRDNPKRLVRHLDQHIVILHDELDRTVPFANSRDAAAVNARIRLQSTRDLGHTRILKADAAIEAVGERLLETYSEAC